MKRAFLFLVLFLAACGISPEPDYYELKPVNGVAVPGITASIKIQQPALPDYLDRPDLVRAESAYQYTIDDMHWWAEPLDRMFERILTEDLRQRLPNAKILSESDFDTNELRYDVETDIEAFNAINPGEVKFKAQLSINDKSGASVIRSQSIEFDAPSGPSPDEIAAALSKLVGDCADRVVSDLRQQVPAQH